METIFKEKDRSEVSKLVEDLSVRCRRSQESVSKEV